MLETIWPKLNSGDGFGINPLLDLGTVTSGYQFNFNKISEKNTQYAVSIGISEDGEHRFVELKKFRKNPKGRHLLERNLSFYLQKDEIMKGNYRIEDEVYVLSRSLDQAVMRKGENIKAILGDDQKGLQSKIDDFIDSFLEAYNHPINWN